MFMKKKQRVFVICFKDIKDSWALSNKHTTIPNLVDQTPKKLKKKYTKFDILVSNNRRSDWSVWDRAKYEWEIIPHDFGRRLRSDGSARPKNKGN